MKNDFMSEQIGNLKAKTQEEKKAEFKAQIDKLHTQSKTPRPLMIDEVAATHIAALRVENWKILGEEFGGYTLGRILAYILEVLNEKIEESVSATIKVDVPLYEQGGVIFPKDFKEDKV